MMTLVGMLFGAGVWLCLQSLSVPKRSKAFIPKRNLWPLFIDEIASGVQVGKSLQEAFFEARYTLPIHQKFLLDRAYFQVQHGSAFQEILKELELEMNSKDFSRLAQLLKISAQQGVNHLGVLLHDFSSAIRRDNELMLEILAKYQTNKIAARVASVSPLIVLLFTASRSEVRDIYLSQEGLFVLSGIVLVSIGGYFAMTKIASLPGLDD
jgi:Flp pilus assembly protein TadB